VCAGAVHIQLILSPSPCRRLVLSKGTVILCAVKANSGIAPVILNDGTRWRKTVSFMPRPLYPRKNSSAFCESVQRAIPKLVLMFCREGKSHASPSNHKQDCLDHSPVTALSQSSGTHKQLQQQYSVHNVTRHKCQNSKGSGISINAPHRFAMAHINQTLAHLKQHKFQSSH
jgi:hypothetical protein